MHICMYMYIFYQKFVIFLKNETTLLFFKNITSIQIKWVICSKKRDSSQFLGKRVGYITFSYSKVGIVFFHLLQVWTRSRPGLYQAFTELKRRRRRYRPGVSPSVGVTKKYYISSFKSKTSKRAMIRGQFKLSSQRNAHT